MNKDWTASVVILSLFALAGAAQTQVLTQLTFDPPYQENPTMKQGCTWSADGDWIAYSRGAIYGRYGAYGIHRVSPSGGPQQLLGPLDPNGPQMPVDYALGGQWLYFLKQDPAVVVGGFPSRMPANGGQWQVLGMRSCPGMFSVSRNGNNILYVTGYTYSGGPGVGLGLLQITRGVDLTLIEAPWAFFGVQVSPTGTAGGFLDGLGIAIISPFGIHYAYAPPFGGGIARWRWGPTGELMACIVIGRFLYLFDLRDGTLRTLTDSPGEFWWSPCGQYIAMKRQFLFGRTPDFAVVEVSSGRVQVLLNLSFTMAAGPASWSPFRDEIALVMTSPPTGTREIFKVSTGLSPIPAVIGTMVPGTTATVRIRSAADANRRYVIAAALGREQGIPTPRGLIPLDPDPLLAASLAGIPQFRGFQGVLDANGCADAFIDVPPLDALVGFRIFVGYLTIDPAQPAGIGTISGSVPVFVQPPW